MSNIGLSEIISKIQNFNSENRQLKEESIEGVRYYTDTLQDIRQHIFTPNILITLILNRHFLSFAAFSSSTVFFIVCILLCSVFIIFRVPVNITSTATKKSIILYQNSFNIRYKERRIKSRKKSRFKLTTDDQSHSLSLGQGSICDPRSVSFLLKKIFGRLRVC
jgi:hypothetical protein